MSIFAEAVKTAKAAKTAKSAKNNKKKLFVLVMEYNNDYSSKISNTHLFMTKKEVNEFLKKEFNKKLIDWKTPTYSKPYVCSCEILTENSRPCPYYSCYLFEKEI
jgi:hypothetical protein